MNIKKSLIYYAIWGIISGVISSYAFEKGFADDSAPLHSAMILEIILPSLLFGVFALFPLFRIMNKPWKIVRWILYVILTFIITFFVGELSLALGPISSMGNPVAFAIPGALGAFFLALYLHIFEKVPRRAFFRYALAGGVATAAGSFITLLVPRIDQIAFCFIFASWQATMLCLLHIDFIRD